MSDLSQQIEPLCVARLTVLIRIDFSGCRQSIHYLRTKWLMLLTGTPIQNNMRVRFPRPSGGQFAAPACLSGLLSRCAQVASHIQLHDAGL